MAAVLAAVLVSSAAFGQTPAGDDLDQEVFWILKSKCVKCHDDLRQSAASGVDDLLDLPTLYESYLDPTDEDFVNDLVLGSEARMPKESFDKVSWNGPLSDAERETLTEWVYRGGPSEAYLGSIESVNREIISLESVEVLIADDLRQLSGGELANARYLTLTNLFNHPNVSDAELEVFRAAIVKTLNSLSQSPDVLGIPESDAPHKLVAVDEHKTIFRFDLRHLGWDSHRWDLVARHSPFAIDHSEASASAIPSLTSSELPYLRADWFTFATLQPPLYHELVGIPQTLGELEESLGIHRLEEIRRRNVSRSGMIESKVSDYNRLLERIPFRGGAYHLSYDNGSNEGESNFTNFPLGPKGLGLAKKFEFKHDGGEAIFNLPNGYQAYVLVDGTGNRLDIAPSAIVQDGSMPRDAIINGISCLSCHFQGMKPERYSTRLAELDVVRNTVSENTLRFEASERRLVEELYPNHDEFQQLIEQDRLRFLNALEEAGIPQRGATEPARELFDRFTDDLDTAGLAAEFGMSETDFRERMSRETETRQLLAIAEQGIFDRQRVLSQFARIARLIGLNDVRDFVPLPFPYYAEDASQFARNDSAQAAGLPTVGDIGVDLIDAENIDGRLKIDVWTADERKSFRDGDPLHVRVRANDACFLTLISIDPHGEMILLMPNRFHGQFQLRRNQTVTIPTEDMAFEFAAQPPHGPTIIKAIATVRPLQLKGVTASRLETEGLPSLGRAKGFGVVRKMSQGTDNRTRSELHSLTTSRIDEQFAQNEWATASVTLTTRP